jgi:hypothetical protein
MKIIRTEKYETERKKKTFQIKTFQEKKTFQIKKKKSIQIQFNY